MAGALTIAYVAIGARTALTAAQNADPKLNIDRFNGEMGYIDRVIGWADQLDQLADGRDLTGVFAYEVAEEFGEKFGLALLSGNAPVNFANQLASDLVDAISEPEEPTA